MTVCRKYDGQKKEARRAKCGCCGAGIVWIDTPKGAHMPCDPDLVYYRQREKGTDRIVTRNGEVLSCEYVVDPANASGVGYVPHWATCPQTDKKRRKNGNKH